MNSPAVLPSHQQNNLEAGAYKDAPIQRINRGRVDPAFPTEAGEPVKDYRTVEMNNDLEAGTRDIAVRSISRWRREAVVLFAYRRFLQTLYLKKEGEKEQASSKVHADAAAELALEIEVTVTSTTGDFGIGREELFALTKNDDVGGPEQYGGIKTLESSLKTNLEDGINGEDADVLKWKSVYGENTDTPEKSTSFLTFLWEACQDISLMIIFIAAVTSSMMGLVTKGTRFGYWEEGGGVAVVVTVNIIFKAICKYSQSQLYIVKEEKRNMHSKEVLIAVPTSIGHVGLAVAFIAMMVLLLSWFTGHNLGGSPKFTGVKTKPRDIIEEVNQIIIIAFTIAVAAVPQGLPLAITLTIVGATKRMVADNVFVRKPFACGTMACAKYFLCDKTVLTLNEDLCQPGVKEKVQLCQGNGVKVRMVTDDNLPTAKAIALECGILGSDADLFDGREFRELTDGERQQCAQRIKVMAWCSPNVKLLFVQALKKSGEMVAVTGYVTDDAPALQEADIGLAMGIQGTEVAKESSDIIILDDSFATCVEAFKWGRFVHANIIKFRQLQLTVNVVALTTNFMAAVCNGHVPLNAVQLLWVNLLIVALVPLSLVTESPPDKVMQGLLVEPGQPPKRYINWTKLGFQSVYQIGGILFINFLGKNLLKSYTSDHATKVKDTMIFNAFVVCQIIHQLAARKTGILSKPKKWIASNYLILGIVGTILTSQFIITEFLGKVFSTVALNQKEWQFSLTIGFTEMLFAIILLVKYLTHNINSHTRNSKGIRKLGL